MNEYITFSNGKLVLSAAAAARVSTAAIVAKCCSNTVSTLTKGSTSSSISRHSMAENLRRKR